MSQGRLYRIPERELTDEQRQTYASIAEGPRRGTPGLVDSEGRLAGPMNTYLYSPTVGAKQASLGVALATDLSLDRRIAELIILIVANSAKASFVLAAHELMGHQAGLSMDQIQALRSGAEPGFDDDLARMVWKTVTQLIAHSDLDDTEYYEAVDLLGERKLVELVTLVGNYRMVALQQKVFRVTDADFGGERLS